MFNFHLILIVSLQNILRILSYNILIFILIFDLLLILLLIVFVLLYILILVFGRNRSILLILILVSDNFWIFSRGCPFFYLVLVFNCVFHLSLIILILVIGCGWYFILILSLSIIIFLLILVLCLSISWRILVFNLLSFGIDFIFNWILSSLIVSWDFTRILVV